MRSASLQVSNIELERIQKQESKFEFSLGLVLGETGY